jgi:hypothetical protein
MPFNFSKTKNFIPKINFPGDEPLNVIYETKLLGIIITSDLRWNAHVKFITGNATKRLWLLIRFKNVGGTEAQLLTVYELKIRSLPYLS